MSILNTEPAVVVAFVTALLGLGAAFGLNLSSEQIAAIMAVITILAGFLVRHKVTPVT